MSHERYADRIDASNACADACEHCLDACLDENDVKMMVARIRLDRDCARLCRLATALMASGSRFAVEACRLCAAACDACAMECERHDIGHCRACAEACRKLGRRVPPPDELGLPSGRPPRPRTLEPQVPRETEQGVTVMRLIPIVAFASLVLCACSISDPPTSSAPGVTNNGLTATDSATEGVAPAHIIVENQYSDLRFINMMAAHHQHAIEMSEVAVRNAEHADVRAMAQKMIEDQRKEIEELRELRQGLDGSRELTVEMNPHEMQESGVPMPSELTAGVTVDAAFLDGMLPHHSGAIRMSSVALRHTENERIASLARRIIDMQGQEIGEMLTMRNARYRGVNHGFPHAMMR